MEVLVLVVLLLAELGLFIYSVKSKPQKNLWMRNKIMVHGGQLGFVLLALLLPSVNLDLRFKALFIILIVRLVIAGIGYAVCLTQAERKNLIAGFFNMLANMAVIAFAIMPAFIFSDYSGLETTGSHEVASAQFIMVDEDREDPFEGAGSKREVPVYAFYPADAGSADVYPLIIFSHGAFGYYQSNMSSYNELASRGYVVLSLDHPHHSFFTKNTKGKIVTVDPQFINDVMYINEPTTPEAKIYSKSLSWIDLRIDDVNFVLDEIENAKPAGTIPANWWTEKTDDKTLSEIISMADTNNIGLYGHSLGGATAVSVGRQRQEVKAVIDLDGTMLGEQTALVDGAYEYYEEPYPTPLLNLISELHHNEAGEAGILYVNNYICDNALNAKTVWFKGTAHMNFTDLPLFSPALASILGVGTVDVQECITTINVIVVDYFDYYLKGEGELALKESY